jgi:hypothetical protein
MLDSERDLNEELDELEDASYSFRERLLTTMCGYQFLLYMAFVLEMMLITLAVLSALFADLKPETQIILLVDFVLLGVATVPTVGLIVFCNRR